MKIKKYLNFFWERYCVFSPKPPPKQKTYKYKWNRVSRSNLKRYCLLGSENSVLRAIRDHEMEYPAPFSDRTLIEMDFMGKQDYEIPFDYREYKDGSVTRLDENIDIPVSQIIGINCSGNLDNYVRGMTFREVLFESLHGTGITEDTVNFLLSNDSKDREMPHSPRKDIPKSFSKRGMEVTQYGDWFVITNGQQRGIIAMYLIWQKFGNDGLLKNVNVIRRNKNPSFSSTVELGQLK